jgi:hypothetical protein
MHKTSVHVSPVEMMFAAIIAKLRSAFASLAPVGYQDENGFHLGEQPADEKETWPPLS